MARAARGSETRRLLAAERGTIHKDAPTRVALVYPSPYRAAKDHNGPVILSVLNGSASTGDVVLQPIDREALARGDLYLGVRSMKGESRAQLQFEPE